MDTYTSAQVCELLGLTYRRLSHWAAVGVLVPSVKAPAGSGSRAIYSTDDVILARILQAVTEFMPYLSVALMTEIVNSGREVLDACTERPDKLYVQFPTPKTPEVTLFPDDDIAVIPVSL